MPFAGKAGGRLSSRLAEPRRTERARIPRTPSIDDGLPRASLKTWLFRILVNRARTRSEREGPTIPFSALWDASREPNEPAVDPDRFLPATDPDWPFHWAVPPKAWGSSPEGEVLAREALELVERAIAELPPAQREVITLRDVEGWESEEVCNVLGISETNQRVLLHRARSRVRAALERYFNVE